MELSEYLLRLNPRELEVLRLVAGGYSRKEAAGLLSISPRTVEQRMGNIIEKLEANNSVHAIAKAIRVGIIA